MSSSLPVGLCDAHDGVALDELLLPAPGVAQRGFGEAVEIAQAAGDLVDTSSSSFSIHPIPLSGAWTAVILEPFLGLVFVALLRDGVPVEHITEADEVDAYLRALASSAQRGAGGEAGSLRPNRAGPLEHDAGSC